MSTNDIANNTPLAPYVVEWAASVIVKEMDDREILQKYGGDRSSAQGRLEQKIACYGLSNLTKKELKWLWDRLKLKEFAVRNNRRYSTHVPTNAKKDEWVNVVRQYLLLPQTADELVTLDNGETTKEAQQPPSSVPAIPASISVPTSSFQTPQHQQNQSLQLNQFFQQWQAHEGQTPAPASYAAVSNGYGNNLGSFPAMSSKYPGSLMFSQSQTMNYGSQSVPTSNSVRVNTTNGDADVAKRKSTPYSYNSAIHKFPRSGNNGTGENGLSPWAHKIQQNTAHGSTPQLHPSPAGILRSVVFRNTLRAGSAPASAPGAVPYPTSYNSTAQVGRPKAASAAAHPTNYITPNSATATAITPGGQNQQQQQNQVQSSSTNTAQQQNPQGGQLVQNLMTIGFTDKDEILNGIRLYKEENPTTVPTADNLAVFLVSQREAAEGLNQNNEEDEEAIMMEEARLMDEARRRSEETSKVEAELRREQIAKEREDKLLQATYGELLHPASSEDHKLMFPQSWLLRHGPVKQVMENIANDTDNRETKKSLIELLKKEKDARKWYCDIPKSYFTYSLEKRLLEVAASDMMRELDAVSAECEKGVSLLSEQKNGIPRIFLQAQKERKESGTPDEPTAEDAKKVDDDDVIVLRSDEVCGTGRPRDEIGMEAVDGARDVIELL